jgi:hypothetical protein
MRIGNQRCKAFCSCQLLMERSGTQHATLLAGVRQQTHSLTHSLTLAAPQKRVLGFFSQLLPPPFSNVSLQATWN